MLERTLLGLALSFFVGGMGYWRHSLSASGWLGAVAVGTLAMAASWAWGLLIIVFFVLSSALSKLGKGRKLAVAEDKFSKTDRRDLGQVLANGGVPALLALGAIIRPHPAWWAAALGAIATATADTWATEVGTLSRAAPRLITTGRRVAPGTSGGVSPLGLAAATLGALTIGLAGWAACGLGLGGGQAGAAWMPGVALVGGVGGSLIDSAFGATVQQIRWCPVCASETERTTHRCGTPTSPLRGWRWLDNDWVNLLSVLGGAGLAAATWLAG